MHGVCVPMGSTSLDANWYFATLDATNRHMYHSARWGGWQFALHSRNDTDHSLNFKCDMINPDGTGGPAGVACPRAGDPVQTAVVQGGWQEGRGMGIGAQYTLPSLNNSYFVENIKEELDVPGEFYCKL